MGNRLTRTLNQRRSAYELPMNQWRRYSTPSGKHRVKPQSATVTHLLEWWAWQVLAAPHVGEDVQKPPLLRTCGMGPPFSASVGQFPKQLNIYFPCSPVFTLLDMRLREMKTCVYTSTGTQVFIGALFAIAPNWTWPVCPSTVKNNKIIIWYQICFNLAHAYFLIQLYYDITDR